MANLARELWEPELDLSSLACDAAIELDNLIGGKSQDLETVKKLIVVIENLGQGLSNSAMHGGLAQLSPTTAVALNSAGAESDLFIIQTDLSGLSNKTIEIIQSLEELVQDPQNAMKEKLEKVGKLKSFCLSLSKHALASKPPLYETESQHPYRR